MDKTDSIWKLFEIYNIITWPWWFFIVFIGVVFIGVEILAYIVLNWFAFANPIAIKGKHLDKLEMLDVIYIYWNRITMIPFAYHAIQICVFTPGMLYQQSEATVLNTVGALVLFYVVYDFIYHQFHRILHIRALYPLVHKHHHRQKAPSRGNLDAINVHPFEFIVGEYLHLFTVYIICTQVMRIHIISVILFIAVGGILASLNHTRYDINILYGYLYSVKVHDVHHRLPESNYSQYTMLWDHIWGTYRPYANTMKISGDEDTDK